MTGLRVTDLEIEVVAIFVEYPVRFLGDKSGGINTENTYHTFLVLQRSLKRTEKRKHLIVGLQHIENGLIALLQERKDMRHVVVFAEPVGGFSHRVLLLIDVELPEES